jgi:hypothetical protein
MNLNVHAVIGARIRPRLKRQRLSFDNTLEELRRVASARQAKVSRATINRNISALRVCLARATAWGIVTAMPLGKIKRRAEDENAVVRYLSEDEEDRLGAASIARDEERRTGRESANEWRRGRGYRSSRHLVRKPTISRRWYCLA